MKFFQRYLFLSFVSTLTLTASVATAQKAVVEEDIIQEDVETAKLIESETKASQPNTIIFNLKKVLEDVYYSNPVLAAERENLASVDENYAQATSGWRPTLAADLAYGFQEQSLEFNSATTATDSTNQRDPLTSSLILTQPIYRGGRTVAQQKQALSDIKAARAQLLDQQQIIFAELVSAYMDVLQGQAQLSLVQNNETVQTKNLTATRDRFDVGDVTITDVSQAEARLARITADVIESEGNMRNAKTRFQRITGFRPDDLAIPSIILPIPSKRQEAEAIALKQNPNLLRQENVYKAAQHNVRAEKGALLPDLSFEARFVHNEDTGPFVSVDETTTILARARIPIYQGGLAFSRIRQANRAAASERFMVIDERRRALTEVRQTWEDLITADARTEALSSEIDATSLALDGVRQESLVGTRTVLDVLDAEQEFLNARVNKTRAERNQVVARFNVLRAIGRLTAPHLNLDVPYYQPAEHFAEIQTKWFGINDNIKGPGLTKVENIDKPIRENVYEAYEYQREYQGNAESNMESTVINFETAETPAVMEAEKQQE